MTLEHQLFEWKDWDGDHECMIYYNPVLKVQIGKFPAGTKFDTAAIMFDQAVLQLCDTGEWEGKFAETIVRGEYKLNLSVGDTLTEG